MRFFKLGLVGTLFLGCLFAQSPTLSFRADQVVVPPSVLSVNRCVQVGIYMDTTDASLWTSQDWAQLTNNLDYTLGGGMVLSGSPVVEVSDFVGTGGTPETGIATPGSPISASTCAAGDVVNVATLATGPAVDYMGDAVTPGSGGGLGFATENVNTGTQHITVGRLHTSEIFRTDDNEHLVAIISFPVDSSTPNGAFIDVTFDAGVNQNIINSATNGAHNGDSYTDGYVVIFDTIDCSGATAADNQGAASGSSIGINYLDPTAGGIGGDITFTMPHGVADPDEIRITPDDGSPVITLTGGSIGSGSTSLSVSTQGDNTPATGVAAVNYTIEYGSLNPLGGMEYGSACTVTVSWNAPDCTVVFDTLPTFGGNTNVDVTLTNVIYDAGNTRFATLTSTASGWGGDVDLNAPSSVAGTVLTYDDAASIAGIDATDVGNYSITNSSGPDGASSPTCSAFLGLECPTNNTACSAIAGPVQIGGDLDINPLSGTNVADWDITYNGVTTNLPGATTMFNAPGVIVGTATSVNIDANGFGSDGLPCNDLVPCTLDFEAPTCSNITQDPAGVVDVGTVLTITVDTTNAVSVTMNGVPMTAGVDPNTNYAVTWTANHTAVGPATLTIVATNPDGETSTCTWDVEVNCAAEILSVGSVGSVGTVYIEGVGGGVIYDIYTADSCANDDGDNLPGDAVYQGSITLVDAGITTGNGPAGHVILPDTCYYVTCEGSPIILDRFAYPTVPTMGEWALIAFSMLLLGAGVVLMRKRREV